MPSPNLISLSKMLCLVSSTLRPAKGDIFVSSIIIKTAELQISDLLVNFILSTYGAKYYKVPLIG